jgi:hypothetical protein
VSFANPPMPAYPHPQRGHRGSKSRRGALLGVFAGVLAAILVVALFAVKSSAPPAPQPDCPGGPCGNPPSRPEQPEPPKPGALIAGTLFSSPGLGYRFEFNQQGSRFHWKIDKKSDTSVVLELNGGVALLDIEGSPASVTPQKALDKAVAKASGRIPDLEVNDDPTVAVLEPSVGYRRGVGDLFGGTFQNPQGAGFPVISMIMAASDSQATVSVTVLTSEDNRALVFSLVDSLMNTFRFPSEISQEQQ